MAESGLNPQTQGIPSAPATSRWRSRRVMVLLLIAALAIVFWPTIETLRIAWTDTDSLTYTHGYLVAAISLWLLMRSAKTLDATATSDWRFAAVLVVLSLCWLLCLRAGIELLHQILLPPMALVAACAAFGVRNGCKLGFGFAYLYFAIPIWSAGNGILQAITVKAVQLLLQITAVPAYVTGNFVYIPAGAFEIAGGCSGLHFFIVAIAIAALFGEIHYDSLRVRIKQLALAAVLAMISNWVRVYVIIVAGHLTDMQHYLITVDHYYFGWFLFVFTMAAFFWLAGRMPASAEGAVPVAGDGGTPSVWIRGAIIALVAAGVGPALNALSPIRDAVASPVLLPASSDRWTGPEAAGGAWRPLFPHADRSQAGDYRREGRVATAFVAQYLQQRQGKELIGYDNAVSGEQGGAVHSRQQVRTQQGDVVLLEAGNDRERFVVAYRYLIGDRRETGDLSAQFAYAAASLRRPVLSQIVAVRTQCTSDCAAATEDATDLLDELDKAIVRAIAASPGQ
ncbi:exosortase A [Povalibacter uvarum]|uniref:Exosortase A n=1 Tax=Povalibacter uvarum TaxID=732238 RepID=A0A841HHS3_9GAMM|nr:exosortase A [Povalibacter uvarum]MBB6091625.1 exosortase A [Povalibacter uvarum]